MIHAGACIERGDWVVELFAAAGAVVPAAPMVGCILGTVDVIEIVSFADVADDPWAFGPWCWRLASPRLLARPLPWKGRLHLFEVPDELLGALLPA